MVSLSDTHVQLIEIVMPGHANTLGILHGGQMMGWLIMAGALTAMRVAKGPIVLGAVDDVAFLTPVQVREIVLLDAQVEHIGRSSMEVGVQAVAEHPETSERKLTTSCHMAFVAVDDQGRPRQVPTEVVPNGDQEKAIQEAAESRREVRQNRLTSRHLRGADIEDLQSPLGWRVESVRSVLPEETIHSDLMFGGRLLKYIDELGAILCRRYSKGVCVTASLDALEFYRPIRVGDILVMQAALQHIGRTSLRIGVKVLVERPWDGKVEHACTSFLTYVHIGKDRRPQPVPKHMPQGSGAG